jgi:hypothetical protein
MARPAGTKKIKTPDIMWQLFEEYTASIKKNPFYIVEQRKGNIIMPKDSKKKLPSAIIKLPAMRPLTMEGFQNHLDALGVISDVTDYFENKDDRYTNYIRICQRIKRTIRQDQIEGGMAGLYNPSITQRLNGLVDKVQQDVKVEQFDLTLNL